MDTVIPEAVRDALPPNLPDRIVGHIDNVHNLFEAQGEMTPIFALIADVERESPALVDTLFSVSMGCLENEATKRTLVEGLRKAAIEDNASVAMLSVESWSVDMTDKNNQALYAEHNLEGSHTLPLELMPSQRHDRIETISHNIETRWGCWACVYKIQRDETGKPSLVPHVVSDTWKPGEGVGIFSNFLPVQAS